MSTMLDAAALAAILDPERKVLGWWDTAHRCSICKQSTDGPARERSMCYWNTHEGEVAAVLAPSYEYIGQPDLHTAREHAWRLEDWLEARNVGWTRSEFYVNGQRAIATRCCPMGQSVPFDPNPNHTAALVAAIERISNESK